MQRWPQLRHLTLIFLVILLLMPGILQFSVTSLEAQTVAPKIVTPAVPVLDGNPNLVFHPALAPTFNVNEVDLEWTSGTKNDNRRECWQYMVIISKRSRVHPTSSEGYPTREPMGVVSSSLKYVPATRDQSPTAAWAIGAEDDKMQIFNVHAPEHTALNTGNANLPCQKLRITGLTEGEYYWTVQAVSLGKAWYYDQFGYHDVKQVDVPPFWALSYTAGPYGNWTGSVCNQMIEYPAAPLGGVSNTALTMEPGWGNFSSCGMFSVDFAVNNVDPSSIFVGPVPYENITVTNNRGVLYATWKPVEDTGSGIKQYQYRIKDITSNVWLTTGIDANWEPDVPTNSYYNGRPSCSMRRTGLSLIDGHQYQVSVRVIDNSGHISGESLAPNTITYKADAIVGDTRRNLYDVLVDMSNQSAANTVGDNKWYDKGDGTYYLNGAPLTWSSASLLSLPGGTSWPNGDSRQGNWGASGATTLNPVGSSNPAWTAVMGALVEDSTWQANSFTYPEWQVQYWGPVKMGRFNTLDTGDYIQTPFSGEGNKASYASYKTVWQEGDGDGKMDSATARQAWEAYYDSQFPIGEYYWTRKKDPDKTPGGEVRGYVYSPSLEAFLANGAYGGAEPSALDTLATSTHGFYDQYFVKMETYIHNPTTNFQAVNLQFSVDNACEIWLNSTQVQGAYYANINPSSHTYPSLTLNLRPGWNRMVVFFQDYDEGDGFWIRKSAASAEWINTAANKMRPFANFDVCFEAFIESYGYYTAKYVSAPIQMDAPLTLKAISWWETPPIENERMVDKYFIPDESGANFGACETQTYSDKLVHDAIYNSDFPVTNSSGQTYSDASNLGNPDNIPTVIPAGTIFKLNFFIKNAGTTSWSVTAGYKVQVLWFKNNETGAPTIQKSGTIELDKYAGDWVNGQPPYTTSDLQFIVSTTSDIAEEVYEAETCTVAANANGSVAANIAAPEVAGFYFVKVNMWHEDAGDPAYPGYSGGFGTPFGKFIQVIPENSDFLTVVPEVAELPTGPWIAVDCTSEALMYSTADIFNTVHDFTYPGGEPSMDAVRYVRFTVNMTPYSTYSADNTKYLGPTGATTASAAPAVYATPYFHAIAITYQYDARPKVLSLIPSDNRWYAGYPYGIIVDAWNVDGNDSLGTCEITLYSDSNGSNPVRLITLFSEIANPKYTILDGDTKARFQSTKLYNNSSKHWINNGNYRKYIFGIAPEFSTKEKYPTLWARAKVTHKNDQDVFGLYPPSGSLPVQLYTVYNSVKGKPFDTTGSNILKKQFFAKTVKDALNKKHFVTPLTTQPQDNLGYFYDQSDPDSVGDVEMNAVYFNGETFFDSSEGTNLTFDEGYQWRDATSGERIIWRVTKFDGYNDALRTKFFDVPKYNPDPASTDAPVEFNKIANHFIRANKTAEIKLVGWNHGTSQWFNYHADQYEINLDGQTDNFVKLETWFYETKKQRSFSFVTESAAQVWINGELVGNQFHGVNAYSQGNLSYSLQEVTLFTLNGWNHLVVYYVDVAGLNDTVNGIAYLLEMPKPGIMLKFPEDPALPGNYFEDMICAHPKPQPNGHDTMDFYNNDRGTVLEILMDGASTQTHQGNPAVEATHMGIFYASPDTDCPKLLAGKPAEGGDHQYSMQVKRIIESGSSEVIVDSLVDHATNGRIVIHVNHKPNIPVDVKEIHPENPIYCAGAPYHELEVIQELNPILRTVVSEIQDLDNPVSSSGFHHSKYITDYRLLMDPPVVSRTDEVRYTYAIATSEVALPSQNIPIPSQTVYMTPAQWNPNIWNEATFMGFYPGTHEVDIATANLQEAHYTGSLLAPIYYYRSWAKDEHGELQYTPTAFHKFIIDRTPPVVFDIQVYTDNEVVRLDKDISPFYPNSKSTAATNSVVLHGHVLTLWAHTTDEICADPRKFKNGRFLIRKHMETTDPNFLDVVNYPWTYVDATVETDLNTIGTDIRFQFDRRPKNHLDNLVWYSYYTIPNDAQLGYYDVDFQVADAVNNLSEPLYTKTSEVQFQNLVSKQFAVQTFMLEDFVVQEKTRIKSVKAEWLKPRDHRNDTSVEHYILSVGDISPEPFNTNNWVSGLLTKITKEVTIEGKNPVYFSPVEKLNRLGFTTDYRDFIATFENAKTTLNQIDGWSEDTSASQLEVGGVDNVIFQQGGYSWKTFAKGTTTNYRIYKDYDIGHNKKVAFAAWIKLNDQNQTVTIKATCYDSSGAVVNTFQQVCGTVGVEEKAWVEYFVRDSSLHPWFITPVGTVKIRLSVEMTNGTSAWIDNLAFASYSEVFVDLTAPQNPEPRFSIKDNHRNTGDRALAWGYWEGVADVRGTAWIDDAANFPTLVPDNQHNIVWGAESARFGSQYLKMDPGTNEMVGLYFGTAEVRLYPKVGDVFAMMAKVNYSSTATSEVNAKRCKGIGLLFNDGVDWNAGCFFSATSDVAIASNLKTELINMIDVLDDTPNPDIFIHAGSIPEGNNWRVLQVLFDDMKLSGHEIAGFAAVAYFPEPAGYTGGDSVAVLLDYMGISAGSGVDFYYPQIKVEDQNAAAVYKDMAMFNVTDGSTGVTIPYSGYMTEDDIFFDDTNFASVADSTIGVQFTGERSLIVDSTNGTGSRDYDGTRLYGKASMRVSKNYQFLTPGNTVFTRNGGGAICFFGYPLQADQGKDSLSEVNVGIKWHVADNPDPASYVVSIAKFRAAQLRPRSLMPPKFDQLSPVGTSDLDIFLGRAARTAIDSGASLLHCSDPFQISLPSVIGVFPATTFFDAGQLNTNLNSPKWDPFLIPMSSVIPSYITDTVEVTSIYIETANCSYAIDALGIVRSFTNKPDWNGDLDPAVFEDNPQLGVELHYAGDGTSEIHRGLDSAESIRITGIGEGIISQTLKVKNAIPNREEHLIKVPAAGGVIAFYMMLGEDSDTWPEEVMIEFHTNMDGAGFYPHRAFWGVDKIARGDIERKDSPDHYEMGELPVESAKNQWVPLMISTTLLDLNGKQIDEIVINVYNGDTNETEVQFDRFGLAGIVRHTGTYKNHFTFAWNAPDYSYYIYRARAWDKIQNASDWGYSALAMSQDRSEPILAHNMTSMINYHESNIVNPYGSIFRDDPILYGDTQSVVFNYDSTEVVTDLTDIFKYPPLDIAVTSDMAIDFRVVPYNSDTQGVRFFKIFGEGAPRPQFGEKQEQVWGQFAAAYDPAPSIGYIVGEWQIDRVASGTGAVTLSSSSHKLEGSASVSLVDANTITLVINYPANINVNAYNIGAGDFVQLKINGSWEKLVNYHQITDVKNNGGYYRELYLNIGGFTTDGTYAFRIYKGASNFSDENLWMVDPQKRFTESHYYFMNNENYVATYYVYDSDRNFAGPYNVYVDVTPGKIQSFRFYHPDPGVSKVTLRTNDARFNSNDRTGRLLNKDTVFWLGATGYDAVGNIVMRDNDVKWTWNGTFLDGENQVHNYIDNYTIDFSDGQSRGVNLNPVPGDLDATDRRDAFPFDVLVRMCIQDDGVTGPGYGRKYVSLQNGLTVLGSSETPTMKLEDLYRSTLEVGIQWGPDRSTYHRPPRPYFEIGYYSENNRLAEELLNVHQFANVDVLSYSTQEVWINGMTGYNKEGHPYKLSPATSDDQMRRGDGGDGLTSGDAETHFITPVRAGETFIVEISTPDGSVSASSPMITLIPGDISKFEIKASIDQENWESTDEIVLIANEGYIYLKTLAYDLASRITADQLNMVSNAMGGFDLAINGADTESVNLFTKLWGEGKKTFTLEDVGTNEIVIKPLWFTSHLETDYPGMGGTVENNIIAGTLPWEERYLFINEHSAGVFLYKSNSSLNQYTAGRQISRKEDDWRIWAVGTTEAAAEDHYFSTGPDTSETREIEMMDPLTYPGAPLFQPEDDSVPGEVTGLASNFYEVFLYPRVSNAPQLKHYIDNQWSTLFGTGTIENVLKKGQESLNYGYMTTEIMLYADVKLTILPPDSGYVGFREPNDPATDEPGPQINEFDVTSFVGGSDAKIDGSDFRLVYIQLYDHYDQFMDYEDSSEVTIILETEDKQARIIPLNIGEYDSSMPDLTNYLEIGESQITDINFTESMRYRSSMGTSELMFYGTQDVRLLTKYVSSLGRTIEVGAVRSQPQDDMFIMSFKSKFRTGSIPVLIAGIDKRKTMTMRVFSKNPAYDDSADLNPNSTAVFHINPNRHDQVHFEPKIHITNPIVQMIEGRELNVQATAYDKNDNMLENLGYFSPGWLPDQGSMFVMDDKGVYPVHYSTGVTPSSVLYGHYNSTGADPAAGTVTVKLFGEYDFVHFGKHGRAATVSVTMISEGYLDIIDLGMFDFPCAYQELDIDKLDRDGVYELSFWVKGYKVTDHANDDSAQIRAGLAFITDDGVSKVAGTALFDLFRGAVAGFKNGHRYETRGDWVRLKTTFTLNGTGKSQNGNDGINNIDSVEKILLYVGTPGTAGGGAPPSYVLYDFINVTRIR